MEIEEFTKVYCADILKQVEDRNKFMGEDDGLPFDDIIKDDSGNMLRVVFSGTRNIPIFDIIDMTLEDFRQIYSSSDDLETRRRYLDSIILLEGEEALNALRNRTRAEIKKIETFAEENKGLLSRYD